MQYLLIIFPSLFFNNFIHVYIVLWSYSFPLPSLIPFSLPLDSVFSMSFFLASTSLFLNYPLRLIRVACMRINVGYYWHIGNLPVKKSNIPSLHSCRYSGVGPLSHAFIHSGVLMGSVFYRICAGDLSCQIHRQCNGHGMSKRQYFTSSRTYILSASSSEMLLSLGGEGKGKFICSLGLNTQ